MAVFGLGTHLDQSEQRGKTAFVKYLTDIMVTQADSTIAEAVDALNTAEKMDTLSCSSANVKKLQAIALARPSISEIGVVNAAGYMVCSSSGQAYRFVGKARSIYDEKSRIHYSVTTNPNSKLVSLVMHRKERGAYGLQALVSPQALFNNPLHSNLRNHGQVCINLLNGAKIISGGNLVKTNEDGSPIETLKDVRPSTSYPIKTTVEVNAAALPSGTFSNVRLFIYLGGLIFCILTGILSYDLSQQEASLKGAIKAGIRRGEFIPFYQPIIDARTGGIAGCEVLIRWRKRDGTIIPPHMFIPEVETSGQISAVTNSLMRTVQEEMSAFQKENQGFFYSINLTASHFMTRDIIEEVQEIFPEDTSSITPADLIFEVTERQPLHDMDAARLIIEGLQSIGSKVALDDAGTGHGGLSYIHHLGVDKIKIDKMFVEAIGKAGPNAPIVDALMTMSRELKIRVIAEGVETAEQLDYLRNHNIDYVQGFLFAKPMPRNNFIHYFNMYHRELVLMNAPGREQRLKARRKAPEPAPEAMIEAAQ